MEDIEDLAYSAAEPRTGSGRGTVAVFRRRKQHRATVTKDETSERGDYDDQVDGVSLSNTPGRAKIYIKTWGCTHNGSDGEYMAGLLVNYGFHLVDNKDEANLWILNSCTVKNPAEDHLKNEIAAAKARRLPVVVSGCVPQGAPKSPFLSGLSIIGVQQIDRVVEVVEETLNGNSVRLLGPKRENGKRTAGPSLVLPKVRRNPLVEIIPINSGCLNHCTYCKTKHARGNLASYSIEEIVARVDQAIGEGVREIWMTSEDTGAYGRDMGTTLPELLDAVVEHIPDGCMLRVGMTNPPYILDYLPEIGKILNHPRVYAFLHVPVQSGSDAVLKEMKREYCRTDFERVVDFLRDSVPGVTIATDIICGFPTETDEDFEDSMSLCAKYKFPSLFINQFYPRPGTPAARMKRLQTQTVKDRSKRLTELFKTYEPYEGREGQVYEVLVTETAHDKCHFVGHNKFYEQVLVPLDESLLGKNVTVEIVSTGKHFMMGKVLGTPSDIKLHGKARQDGEPTRTRTPENVMARNGDATSVCRSVAASQDSGEKSRTRFAHIAGLVCLVFMVILYCYEVR